MCIPQATAPRGRTRTHKHVSTWHWPAHAHTGPLVSRRGRARTHAHADSYSLLLALPSNHTQTELALAFPPTRSSAGPGGNRAPLTFPPLNPRGAEGSSRAGAWQGGGGETTSFPLGGPALEPPLWSRSRWSWGRWRRAAARPKSGADTQGSTLPSSGVHSPGQRLLASPDLGRAWMAEKAWLRGNPRGPERRWGRRRRDTMPHPFCRWQLPLADPKRD